MSFSAGFAAGLLVGKKKWGAGGDDWQPPDIPEPEDYEIYLLIEVVDVSDRYTSKLEIRLAHPEIVQTGYGPMSIDWGDGTVDEWTEVTYTSPDYPDYYSWHNLTHNYAKVGRYLVKISATEYSCFLQRLEPIGSMQYAKVIGAKLGREIVVNNGNDNDVQAAFHKQIRLQYVKLNGKGGLPKTGFFGCIALMRIDIATVPEKIYANQFYNCVNLKSFNFSKVTELPPSSLYGAGFTKLDLPKCVRIDGNGISVCKNLKKINAPLCETVGDSALLDCYGLEDVKFSDDCVFGNNCFQGCVSLYPRPDGSVN